MKHRVKFKAITYRGDVVNKTVKVDGPEFKEYSEALKINGKEYSFNVTIEDQLIDWLDTTDKTEIMAQNNWYTILDYKVPIKVVKQTKAEKLEEFKSIVDTYFKPWGDDSFEHVVKLRDDFMVTYIKMFDKIQTLSAERQFIIVMGTLDTAYTAQTEVYKHAIKLIQATNDKDLMLRVVGSRQRSIN
jgi:hypothetical protein